MQVQMNGYHKCLWHDKSKNLANIDMNALCIVHLSKLPEKISIDPSAIHLGEEEENPQLEPYAFFGSHITAVSDRIGNAIMSMDEDAIEIDKLVLTPLDRVNKPVAIAVIVEADIQAPYRRVNTTPMVPLAVYPYQDVYEEFDNNNYSPPSSSQLELAETMILTWPFLTESEHSRLKTPDWLANGDLPE